MKQKLLKAIKKMSTEEQELLRYLTIKYIQGDDCNAQTYYDAIKSLSVNILFNVNLSLYRGITVVYDTNINYLKKHKYGSFSSNPEIAKKFILYSKDKIENYKKELLPIIIYINKGKGFKMLDLVKALEIEKYVDSYIYNENEYFIKYKSFDCKIGKFNNNKTVFPKYSLKNKYNKQLINF